MKLSGDVYELWDWLKEKQPKEGPLLHLLRHDEYLPKGTAVHVNHKFRPGTFLTTPMTSRMPFAYAMPPPTEKTTYQMAYIDNPEVAFGGCVWHIGGGNSYNITVEMARDDRWYVVEAKDYPRA